MAKPVHIDDPLFVWVARQVAARPLDPYGFTGNWAGRVEPAFHFIQNPPGASYYLAAVGRTLGWGEVALHASLLPVAALTAVGTALLAGRFGCRRPAVAAGLLVASPAFLVSSTTLMCDGLFVCLWVWAVYLFDLGSAAATGRAAWAVLGGAGIVAAAAGLTKYPGVNLVPLLAAHAVLCPARRPGTRWPQAAAILLPVVTLLAYDRATAARYGVGLVADAIGYSHTAAAPRSLAPPIGRAVDDLCFVGGGVLSVAAVGLAAAGRGRRWMAIPAAVALLGLAAAHWMAAPQAVAAGVGPPPWTYFAQAGVLATLGLTVVLVCWAGVTRDDRRRGLFLLVWVAGVFAFAGYFNWSINARTILPLAPAACILAGRATDRLPAVRPAVVRYATLLAGGVAVLVTVVDDRFATDNRAAADQITHELVDAAGGRPPRVWFAGHWGFQFYMERGGGRPLAGPQELRVGDYVVLPLDNDGSPPPAVPLLPAGQVVIGSGSYLATVSRFLGGGFYFSPGTWLPFVVGPVPPQAFLITRVGR